MLNAHIEISWCLHWKEENQGKFSKQIIKTSKLGLILNKCWMHTLRHSLKEKKKASFLIKPWRQGPPWENVECAHWDILKPTLNIEKKQSKFSNQTTTLLVEKQSWVCGKESGGERKTWWSKSAISLVEFNLTLFINPLWAGMMYCFQETCWLSGPVLLSIILLTPLKSKSLASQYHFTWK